MAKEPKPTQMLDISGPEGETVFWHLKEWLVKGSEDRLQARFDQMWANYKDITDDRLLAVVAALCVEDSVNALIKAIAPDFSDCVDDKDFTFSMRIGVARSLRLIPGRILTGCDLVRQIRNEFAHNLDIKELGRLDPKKYLNKLAPYVNSFNKAPRSTTDYRHLFRELVGFTLIALNAYTDQVKLLRDYLETTSFPKAFKHWAKSLI